MYADYVYRTYDDQVRVKIEKDAQVYYTERGRKKVQLEWIGRVFFQDGSQLLLGSRYKTKWQLKERLESDYGKLISIGGLVHTVTEGW